MRDKALRIIAAAVVALAMPSSGHAEDASLERAKEMLHRTQEALRQEQAQNAELIRAKAEAEQKAVDASSQAAQQIESAKGGSKALERGLRGQLQSSQGAQTALKQEVSTANAELAAMSEKQRATAQLLANRDAELTQTKQLLELSKAANVSCEDKNDKLYTYGHEMLDRYQKKGVFSALAQKEPVLGLKEVEIENVVQEYKLKMAAAKIKPATP